MNVRGNILSLFVSIEYTVTFPGALTNLTHNTNVKRSNAKTADGRPRFDLVCSRDGKRWYIRMVKEEKDSRWMDGICEFVVECVDRQMIPKVEIPVGSEVTRVRSRSEKPDKSEAFAKHQTRMNLSTK